MKQFRSHTTQPRLVTKSEGHASGTSQAPQPRLGLGNVLCTVNNTFCSTWIELSEIHSFRENKDAKFRGIITSWETSGYLRICLPQHEVTTKHLFLSTKSKGFSL